MISVLFVFFSSKGMKNRHCTAINRSQHRLSFELFYLFNLRSNKKSFFFYFFSFCICSYWCCWWYCYCLTFLIILFVFALYIILFGFQLLRFFSFVCRCRQSIHRLTQHIVDQRELNKFV